MYPGQHMSIEDNIFMQSEISLTVFGKKQISRESISRSLLQKRFSKVLKLLT